MDRKQSRLGPKNMDYSFLLLLLLFHGFLPHSSGLPSLFYTFSLKEKINKKTSSTDFTIFHCNHHRVKIKFDIKLKHGYAEIERAVILFFLKCFVV